MNDVVASAGVAAAAALGGSGLTALISFRLAAQARRDRRQDDLASALAAFGYAIDRLRIELGELPPPPGITSRRMNRALSRLPTADWWLRQATRHTLARPGRRAYDGVIATTNRLLLVATEEIVGTVHDVHALLEDPKPHEEEWRADWTRVRAEVVRASRRVAVS